VKILLLSPNQIKRKNWTHSHFRLEIGRQHDVMYYGEGYPNYVEGKTVPEIIQGQNFDLILTYGLRYTEPFIGIGEVKNIPKAHIAVDYFPKGGGSGTYERNHQLFNRDKYDIYFGVVGDVVRNLEKNGVCKKAYLLPFSVDTDIYKRTIDQSNRKFDVFSVFTTRDDIYPNRNSVHKLVKSMEKNNNIKTITHQCQHEEYINNINNSKIGITSNNKFKSLSIKYYEIMACGAMLLADEPEDLTELGFVNEQHLVIYENIEDLKDKILFYLKNPKSLRAISNQGMEFIHTNHNNKIRVQQFTDILKKELGGK
jgi:spore maturation protein CgeB